MQNLEQIRAKNALTSIERHGLKKTKKEAGEDSGGDILSGYPALVINNGLLATFAYSKEKKKKYKGVYDAIQDHLREEKVGLLPEGKDLLDYLKEESSAELRLCTAETLAFLAYLKRFAKI